MIEQKFQMALKYSIFTALILSLIGLGISFVDMLPRFNDFFYILLVGVPIVTMLISFICTIIFIIPSVILLEKINLDKKIPVVIIGTIVGILIWYLSTIEVRGLYMILLYSVTCSYFFMVGYEKHKRKR